MIAYGGTLDDERNPTLVFRAARRLLDSGVLEPGDVRFDFIGRCQTPQGRALEDIAARWRLEDRLHLHGVLGKAETFRKLVDSSILLLLAGDWALQIPAKAYEYLRAGWPILALAPSDGAVAALFRETGGEWVLDPSDDDGIAAALHEAYGAWKTGQPTRAPDSEVVPRFDRARLVGELAAVLRRITPQRSGIDRA